MSLLTDSPHMPDLPKRRDDPDPIWKEARVPLLLFVTLAAGIFIGARWFGHRIPQTDRSVGTLSQKFKEVLWYVDQYYVDTVQTERLTNQAIEQMLNELDPHTAYLDANSAEVANSTLQGDFDGIGVEYGVYEDTMQITNTMPDGPAERAGLLPGDQIIEVEGQNICQKSQDKETIAKMLRGKRGTQVNIRIRRGDSDQLLPFTLTRDKIQTPSIEFSYMPQKDVGYIRLTRFGAKTDDEFKNSLETLLAKGMKKLILDLRGNSGGYLDKAVYVTDQLVAGKKLVVFTDGKGTQFDESLHTDREGLFEEGPVIVLIDEYSASAAEIVAGALQDHDRALLIGRRSYGKGLVQKPIRLSDGSELRLTISRYYTPSGRSIQKPYQPGQTDDYAEDLKMRYEKGEFFFQDSIRQDSSKLYHTTAGRNVYGGGGIVPDVFIPKDTSYYSSLVEVIYDKNLIRCFAFDYALRYRGKLLQMGIDKYQSQFDPADLMPEFWRTVRRRGIDPPMPQTAKAERYVREQLKAYIARTIWKNPGYYQVSLAEDPVMHKALNSFTDATRLAEQVTTTSNR